MTLTELFFLVVYISVIGGLFGVVSLFLSRVLKRSLPLWFSLCVLALYGIPVLSPQVRLLSPEPEQRLPAFRIAALVWAVGCALFLIFRAVRLLLAGRSLRCRPPCQNQRLLALTAQCAQSLGIKRVPILRETLLTSPISVAGALRPVLLVDAAVLSQLTDAQLQAVLTHELTHIRRHHLLFQRMYDAVCAVHWFNPVAWLCREDFALHCETDCDACALRSLTGSVTSGEYARAILRCVAETGQRFGAGLIAAVLCGGENEKIRRYRLERERTYGALAALSQREVQDRIRFLVDEHILELTDGQYPVLRCGERAEDVAYSDGPLMMKAVREERPAADRRRAEDSPLTERQQALFQRLREERAHLARLRGVPAFVIFSDKTLREMAAAQPRDLRQLQNVGGVGSFKAEQYGAQFLEIISDFQETAAI